MATAEGTADVPRRRVQKGTRGDREEHVADITTNSDRIKRRSCQAEILQFFISGASSCVGKWLAKVIDLNKATEMTHNSAEKKYLLLRWTASITE